MFSVTSTAVAGGGWGSVIVTVSIFFVNADAFIENPNNFSLSKFLLSVSPTRRAECAEHCNYFVQYLVKVLVC